MYIYVLDKDGKPLLPTRRAGKVRRMLVDGMATVVRRTPFTIRLAYDTPHYVHPLTVGQDTEHNTSESPCLRKSVNTTSRRSTCVPTSRRNSPCAGSTAATAAREICETCHDAYHKGKIELKLKRSFQSLRDAAVMNVMRWEVLRQTEMALGVPVTHTIGYMTKYARIHAGLEKSHVNDALCIAGHPHAQRCENIYLQKKTARHIRQAQKANILSGGRRKANKLPYVVKGFRLFDKVRYGGQECFVFGRRISGYFDLRRLDGTRVHASAGYKKIRFLETSKGYITQMFNQSNKENAFPLTTEVASIHA